MEEKTSGAKAIIITTIVAIIALFTMSTIDATIKSTDLMFQVAFNMYFNSNSERLNEYWAQGEKEHLSQFAKTIVGTNQGALEDGTTYEEFAKMIYPYFNPKMSDPYIVMAKSISEAKTLSKTLKPANLPMSSNDNVMIIRVEHNAVNDTNIYYLYMKKHILFINRIIFEETSGIPE